MLVRGPGALWGLIALCSLGFFSCDKPHGPIVREGDLTGYVRIMSSYTPIPGTEVTCAGQTGVVGNSGIYQFWGIPQGVHILRAVKPGFAPHEASVYIGRNTSYNIYMTRSVVYGNLSGYVSLSGSAQPVPGVTVSCAGKSDTTGADGWYLLDSVVSGTHSLRARKDHYLMWEAVVSIAGDTTINVYMASSTISGYVTHIVDGPVADARIEVGQVVGYSDSEGHYRIPHVPQGTHTVKCTHEIYNTFLDTVKIRGDEKRFDFVLTKSQRDTLMVTDDAGVGMALFEGCGDCPEWMSASDNRGQDSLLRLEYFMRSSEGPPSTAFTGRTRFYVALPAMPEGVSLGELYRATLHLKPAGQSGEPGYITARLATSSSCLWDEDDLTWDNAPVASALPLASTIVPQGETWQIDVTPAYRDLTCAEPGVRVQMEETGSADPKEYFYFWSGEAPASENRPYVVLQMNAH